MKSFTEWKNLHEHGGAVTHKPGDPIYKMHQSHSRAFPPRMTQVGVYGPNLERLPMPTEAPSIRDMREPLPSEAGGKEELATQLDDAAKTADKMGLPDMAMQLRRLVKTVISSER